MNYSANISDIDREDLKDRFQAINENFETHGDLDDFYKRAGHIFVRLYARAHNEIKNQLAYLVERLRVQNEREERGYS